MSAPPTYVLAGGGTGGHLVPALAVARELAAGGARVVFVGTARGLETRLVPEAGFELRQIRIGGLKTGSAGRRLRTLAQLPGAVWQSRALLEQLRPQAVLGIGGYASGPVLAAARLRRIPLVLMEVNVRAGLANRWAGRWARSVAVNFAATAPEFRHAQVTGIPVREAFFALGDQPLPPAGVLVTGGSQGAHAINEAVRALAAALPQPLLHQTGTADCAACAAAYAPLGGRARAVAFVADMAQAMAEAAVVVARAGASTLGELAAARRPAILIPYPGAADQHQLRNARAYAAAGAAVVLEQHELTPERLRAAIASLLAAPERLAAMRAAAASQARPAAARAIAELVASS